jgi:hypothetical protein
MHARYYSFEMGRFMSVDPVGGEVGLSQSWNRYAYVRGNPVNAVDPDGRSPLAVLGAAGKWLLRRALVGAAVGAATRTAIDTWKALREQKEPITIRSVARTALRQMPRSAPRGALVGGANAVPVLGAGLAATAIEYHDQRKSGKSREEAAAGGRNRARHCGRSLGRFGCGQGRQRQRPGGPSCCLGWGRCLGDN